MGGLHWVTENWLPILNAAGIVGGLFFTAVALRSDTKTRKIANLLTITTNHREIWKEFLHRPELSRVLDRTADLSKKPVTAEEQEFVNFVILHLNSVYYAMRDEMIVQMEGLRRDAGEFFSLPIPGAVWQRTKIFQNRDFIAFVEVCQKEGHRITN